MDTCMQFVIVNRRMAELRREAEGDRLARAGRLSRIVSVASRTASRRRPLPLADRPAA